MSKAPFLFEEMLTSAIMRKETAIHIFKADFINRPNLFVNRCADYPINYLPPKAPMIRNRTGFFDDVALNEIKTAADSFYYLS